MRFSAVIALFVIGCVLLPLRAAQAGEKLAWTVKPAHGGPAFTIIGSAAFLGVNNYPLPEYVRQAYDQSGALLFEADFAALDKPAFGEKLRSAMILPSGKTLASESSTAYRKALFDRCAELKIDAGALKLQTLQPWGAALTIFSAANAKIGLEGRYATDRALHTMAVVDGKPIMTLEPPERILELISQWPEGSPKEEFGRQLMVDQTIVSQNLSELRAAWQRGDLAYLEQTLSRTYAPFPNLHQRMIGAPGRLWTERLARGAPLPPRTLAVLPLIYLIGPDGLLAQLGNAGCIVERMK